VYLTVAAAYAVVGLRSIMNYRPLYPEDIAKLRKYAIHFNLSLGMAVASLFIGGELAFHRVVSKELAEGAAYAGFTISLANCIWQVAQAESHYKATKSCYR
jgi:hypothetical protein